MGKRELLLIGGFVLVGCLVYWATAPAAAPGERGFSLSTILDRVHREVRGNQASSELTTTQTLKPAPTIREVRFEIERTPTTIIGEDRLDIACELAVWSNGYDEAEAKRLAGETKLKTSEAGTSLVLGIVYPEPGRQRASLTVRLPKTLAVRVQPSRAKLDISNVAAAEIVESRGQVTVRDVPGRVVVIHRGGELTLEDVGAVKLNSRGSVVTLKNVKGEMVAQLQAGELRGGSFGGSIEIESQGSRIALEDLSESRKPIRVNAVGGVVTLGRVASETRVDGRDTRIDVELEKPVPLAIYNEDEEPTRVTLPGAGVRLDALTTDGRLIVPDGLLDVKKDGNEQRASGAIKGGGPTITLRTKRGTIEIRDQK
jgi:hypothetical protein